MKPVTCPTCGQDNFLTELTEAGVEIHPRDARVNVCGLRTKWPRSLRLTLSGLLVVLLGNLTVSLYLLRDVNALHEDVRALIHYVVKRDHMEKINGTPDRVRSPSGDRGR